MIEHPVESWLYKWKIKINTYKSISVAFIRRRQVPQNRLKLFEQEVPHSAEAKYLSIHLEIKLTWKAQI
jgi:hypothetical protein